VSDDGAWDPEHFQIQGSNNDSDWTDLTDADSHNECFADSFDACEWSRYYPFDNNIEYRYYRILITHNYGGGDYDVFNTLSFYKDEAIGGSTGETGQSCVVDYDTVIDLGEYDNAFACYAEEGFWDSFRQICFDYTCTDLYYDYRDYVLPANYVCVVDLEDEEEEYEDYPSCIVGGGYWWLNTCYAMDCNQGFSSDDFGLDFDGENSTTTLADLEVSGLLALIVPANLPTRVHNFVSRNIMAFTTIFPLNILYNYNAFFYNMLDCAGEEQDDIYFNASLPIHFFPGQNDETQTLMDFGSLDQVNDLEIDIQGLHFDNLWDFSRKIFFLLLLLAYLNYVINFMGRIWGSGKK